MKQKKLYFFNVWWRNYPKWMQIAFVIIIVGIYISLRFLIEDFIVDDVLGVTFWVSFYGYLIFQATRKNAVYYSRDSDYSIKINGKKIDYDLKFLSEVWLEDKELNIRRIKRIDTFSIAHLREEDVEKLMAILKEYEPELV